MINSKHNQLVIEIDFYRIYDFGLALVCNAAV